LLPRVSRWPMEKDEEEEEEEKEDREEGKMQDVA
jgi:hypothetical protein